MFTKAVVVPGETRTGHWVPLQPVAAHAGPRQPMPAHASSPPHRSQRHSARKNHVALPCTAQAPPRCRSVLPTLYPPALLPTLLPAQPHCSLAVAPRCHVNTQVAPSMSCLCMVVLARQTHPGPRHLCNHRRTSQNSSGNGVTAPACQVPCSLTCRPAYASKLKMAGARICGPDLHRAGWGFGHYHRRLINGWLPPARPLFHAVSIFQAPRFIATETRQKAMALNEEPNRPYFCMPIS
jgi:hypothetical protein